MSWRAAALGLGALLLAGCEQVQAPATTRAVANLPAVENVAFPGGVQPRGVRRSNAALAQDFIDLTFQLERGEPLRGLLRYEAPVRVYIRSPALRPYAPDVEKLLARFRAEAGVDIRTTTDPGAAQLHIDGVSLREIQRVDPGAACFIVPGETSWREFRSKSSRARQRWADQTTLGRTAIFIPTDTFPQDVRDCLHEELAQSLGPANDLYRLPDSVYNDDNFHSVVTRFDMLMLRALYSEELRSGMPRAVVAGRIRDILRRINPGGEGIGTPPRAPASAQWKRQIELALTRRNAPSRRLVAADRAVALARAMRPPDHRLGVALITRGRLLREFRPGPAASDFLEAHRFLEQTLGRGDIRTAQAALHVALIRMEARDLPGALRLAREATPAARAGQNAVLLSSLLAVQSAVLAAMGDVDAARRSQLEYLKWARYAYGDADGTRRRAQAELEADLGPAASRKATP